MADLNKLLTYLIEQLPTNKLLKVCEHIQPKKTGTNDYLSCEEFLDNIWNRAELRKIYEIKVGENEDEGKEDSEKEDAVKIDANNEDGISVNKWNEIFKTKEIGIDYRIKKIEFEKLKYYPEKVNDYLFGTSFVDLKGNPKSALILGNNGVGKTSIYQAIEFSFRNQIGEVFLRDYDFADTKEKGKKNKENLCKKYLINKEYSKEEVTAFIETVNSQTGINNPLIIEHKSLQKYLANLFFISDYEIYKLGRLKYEAGNNNSFRMFMSESLDLGELIWFNRLMGKLSCYKKYAEIFDDKSEETEYIKNESRKIESLKDEIVKLYDQRIEVMHLITGIENSKHNHIAYFLDLFIFKIKQKNTITKLIYRKKDINDLKTEFNEITDCINSIKSENEKIYGIVGFESLLKSNVDLLSVLKKIESEIDLVVYIDPKSFITQTEDFLNKIQLSINYKYITTEYENERKKIIDDIKTKISTNDFKILINNVIKTTKHLSYRERNISDAEKNMEEIILKNIIIEKINSDAKQIFEVINDKITYHFNKSIKEVTDTINDVMDKFLVKHNEELKWQYEDLKIVDFESGKYPQYLSLKMNLKENEENSKIGIKRYFNTFRYRMFSILLVISTSFAVMKKLKINFPIVIDDVFHANDFNHRTEIKKMINSIIESHKGIFGDSQELQLIIFTHDDLIFNSIKKCILENKKNNFGFYRLLDYKQAEKDDMNEINDVLYEYI